MVENGLWANYLKVAIRKTAFNKNTKASYFEKNFENTVIYSLESIRKQKNLRKFWKVFGF